MSIRRQNPTRAVRKSAPRSTSGRPSQPSAPGRSASRTVGELRTAWGLSRKLFSRLTGFSERAIAGWEAGQKPSSGAAQRLREVERLYGALGRVMRPEVITTWCQTPNSAFDGLKPLEVLERGEVDRIWRMIYQLESGVPD